MEERFVHIFTTGGNKLSAWLDEENLRLLERALAGDVGPALVIEGHQHTDEIRVRASRVEAAILDAHTR